MPERTPAVTANERGAVSPGSASSGGTRTQRLRVGRSEPTLRANGGHLGVMVPSAILIAMT